MIGRGGQSTVYRAHDRIDGDDVAIKLVHGALGDPDATERIFREAQSMSQLLGTSAVRILHQVRTNDGALGLVMEPITTTIPNVTRHRTRSFSHVGVGKHDRLG